MRAKANPVRPYERMARYYDWIYHELVDYEADCDFLERIFSKHRQGRVRSILDLGCGTGNHAIILARRGYKVTGIDQSKEMVALARRKSGKSRSSPEFLRMDMRKVRLGRKFDAAIAMFGGFGYLLENSDIRSFLSSVRQHIPDGLLVYEFWHNSAVRPQASTPDGHTTWERFEDRKVNRVLIRLDTSKYDAQTNLLKIDFDFYVIDYRKKRLLDAFSERHTTRTYSMSEMRRLLEENGFLPLAFYHGELNEKSLTPAGHSTFRVACVARPSSA